MRKSETVDYLLEVRRHPLPHIPHLSDPNDLQLNEGAGVRWIRVSKVCAYRASQLEPLAICMAILPRSISSSAALTCEPRTHVTNLA